MSSVEDAAKQIKHMKDSGTYENQRVGQLENEVPEIVSGTTSIHDYSRGEVVLFRVISDYALIEKVTHADTNPHYQGLCCSTLCVPLGYISEIRANALK